MIKACFTVGIIRKLEKPLIYAVTLPLDRSHLLRLCIVAVLGSKFIGEYWWQSGLLPNRTLKELPLIHLIFGKFMVGYVLGFIRATFGGICCYLIISRVTKKKPMEPTDYINLRNNRLTY